MTYENIFVWSLLPPYSPDSALLVGFLIEKGVESWASDADVEYCLGNWIKNKREPFFMKERIKKVNQIILQN